MAKYASRVGIAVITCNRPALLKTCLRSILRFAGGKGVSISVFDDCSDKELVLPESERLDGVNYFGNDSRSGVVFNKNRALYYYSRVSPSKYIFIVEDDMEVVSESWLGSWLHACKLHGHMNYAPPWFFNEFHSRYCAGGSGSPGDPYRFGVVTGQCSAVRRSVITRKVGYLNPRFAGYGHGHVEWTNRMIMHGYGGLLLDGKYVYYGLADGLRPLESVSHKDPSEQARNSRLFRALKMGEKSRDRVVRPWASPRSKEALLRSLGL